MYAYQELGAPQGGTPPSLFGVPFAQRLQQGARFNNVPPSTPTNLDPNSIEFRKYQEDVKTFRQNNPNYVPAVGASSASSGGQMMANRGPTRPGATPSPFNRHPLNPFAMTGGMIKGASAADWDRNQTS